MSTRHWPSGPGAEGPKDAREGQANSRAHFEGQANTILKYPFREGGGSLPGPCSAPPRSSGLRHPGGGVGLAPPITAPCCLRAGSGTPRILWIPRDPVDPLGEIPTK